MEIPRKLKKHDDSVNLYGTYVTSHDHYIKGYSMKINRRARKLSRYFTKGDIEDLLKDFGRAVTSANSNDK